MTLVLSTDLMAIEYIVHTRNHARSSMTQTDKLMRSKSPSRFHVSEVLLTIYSDFSQNIIMEPRNLR